MLLLAPAPKPFGPSRLYLQVSISWPIQRKSRHEIRLNEADRRWQPKTSAHQVSCAPSHSTNPLPEEGRCPPPTTLVRFTASPDYIAVLALGFEVFWSSFQPPQVVMVPAAQSCDWSELQIVSMAIERICAERTLGLGNELMGTLLGNEPPLQGEGGAEGREANRDTTPARASCSPSARQPTLVAQLPNPKCCYAGSHRGCRLQIRAVPNKKCKSGKHG